MPSATCFREEEMPFGSKMVGVTISSSSWYLICHIFISHGHEQTSDDDLVSKRSCLNDDLQNKFIQKSLTETLT